MSVRGRPPASSARYRQIAEDLRQKIQAGVLKPGQPLPSLRSLAKRYATGQFTVRLAIKALKREGRILGKARRQMTVLAPQGPYAAANEMILLVLSDLLSNVLGYFEHAQVLHGIQKGAGFLGAPILTVHHPHYREAPPSDLDDLRLRGAILLGKFSARGLGGYETLDVPVVLADRPEEGHRIHTVCVDNADGGRQAASRLVALGHRRIAFLRGIQTSLRAIDPDIRERQAALARALLEAGLSLAPSDVFNTVSSDRPESPTIQSLLNTTPRYTAVVAASAGRASLVAQAAKARGLKIPQDLSLICFQGLKARYPECTGPRVDFEELGHRTVLLLQERRHPVHRIRIPITWLEGKTLGPPPI